MYATSDRSMGLFTICETLAQKGQFQLTRITHRMKVFCLVLSILLLFILLAGCSIPASMPATTLTAGNLPTNAATDEQSGQVESSTPATRLPPADFPPRSPTPSPSDEVKPRGSTTPLALTPSSTPSPTYNASPTTNLSPTSGRRATLTPTITSTPPIPGAGVQFVEPGPMSKVISPLHLIANFRSVPSGTYHIELWLEPLHDGEPPRLLYREVQRLISNPVDWVYLDQDIQFELSRVSEYAQLRVSVYDTLGRPISINSVDLLLLSIGTSQITPSTVRSEPIVIREPLKNKLIQGGTVVVSGLAQPSEDFMLVELLTAEGVVVGYRQVYVTPAPDGSYVPFAVEVPYQVETPVWVLVRISESGTRITGYEHLSSVEVYLSP
jgi:hypothetical protein